MKQQNVIMNQAESIVKKQFNHFVDEINCLCINSEEVKERQLFIELIDFFNENIKILKNKDFLKTEDMDLVFGFISHMVFLDYKKGSKFDPLKNISNCIFKKEIMKQKQLDNFINIGLMRNPISFFLMILSNKNLYNRITEKDVKKVIRMLNHYSKNTSAYIANSYFSCLLNKLNNKYLYRLINTNQKTNPQWLNVLLQISHIEKAKIPYKHLILVVHKHRTLKTDTSILKRKEKIKIINRIFESELNIEALKDSWENPQKTKKLIWTIKSKLPNLLTRKDLVGICVKFTRLIDEHHDYNEYHYNDNIFLAIEFLKATHKLYRHVNMQSKSQSKSRHIENLIWVILINSQVQDIIELIDEVLAVKPFRKPFIDKIGNYLIQNKSYDNKSEYSIAEKFIEDVWLKYAKQ